MKPLLNRINIDVVGKNRLEAYNNASGHFNNIYGTLDVAVTAQFDIVSDMIEDTPYYKQEVKRAVNKTRQLLDLYHQRLRTAFADRYVLYADYANACYRIAEPDAEKIYYCIKNVLDKYRQKDSDLKARMMTAKELLKQTSLFHRTYWRKIAEVTGYKNIGQAFSYSDFTPILRAFTAATDRVCRTDDDTEIELGNDDNCNRAVTAFMYRVADTDRQNDAASVALSWNKDNPAYAEIIRKEQEILHRHEAEEQKRREEKERQEAEQAKQSEEKERERIKEMLSTKFKVK